MIPTVEKYNSEEARACQLTPERVVLFGCPCDWKANTGFEPNNNDALDILHGEWVGSVAAHSVSWREAAVAAWVFDERGDPYADDEEMHGLVINMRMRREPSVRGYMQGIGRLDHIKFLSPSHDGKHYSSTSLTKRRRLSYSQFFLDLRPDTIGSLFWSWFGDVFSLSDMTVGDAAEEPLRFLHDTEELWKRFLSEPQVRVAMDTTAAIGFLGKQDLQHIALDVNLAGGVVHPYPVTPAEAERIMSPFQLRPIKSKEYS